MAPMYGKSGARHSSAAQKTSRDARPSYLPAFGGVLAFTYVSYHAM